MDSTRQKITLEDLFPGSETLSNTSVVHAMPGRIRLRVQRLKFVPALAQPLETFLKAHPGIIDASVNAWCYSVTVTCDPLYWTADTLRTFLQQVRQEEIERYRFLPSPRSSLYESVTAHLMQPSHRWKIFGYITLVLGIILFALPVIPGGIPFLVLSAFCFSRATALVQIV